MKTLSKILFGVMSVATLGAVAAPASAEGTWGHRHPRQHEVLTREHRQLHRINVERREGDISGAQAHVLRHEDRSIARQEHFESRARDGSISKPEQRQLNGELNATSHQIGN